MFDEFRYKVYDLVKPIKITFDNLVKPIDFVDDGNGLYRCNIFGIEWLD